VADCTTEHKTTSNRPKQPTQGAIMLNLKTGLDWKDYVITMTEYWTIVAVDQLLKSYM